VQAEPAFLARVEQIRRDTELVRDPGVEPEQAAGALQRLFELQLPSPEHGAALVEDVGPERARALVDAALRGEPAAAVLALAADLALAGGDPGAAAEHVLRAQGLADHPYLRLRLARSRERQGRVVEAVQTLREGLERDPGLQEGQLLRGELLARLAAWEAGPSDACPCGSGRAYDACCREAAGRLLAEFRDREQLQALGQAVETFVAQKRKLKRFVADSLKGWGRDVGLDPDHADDEESARLVRLAIERAWTTPMDDGERTILSEFAADAQTPAELAELASEWGSWKAWGLWQVDELGEPGVLLTEYVTGTRVYAQISPEQREGLQRWSVLLGCFGPVHGIWRSGSSLLQVSPEHARALAWRVLWFAERVGRKAGAPNRPVADWARRVCRELEERRWLPDRAERPPRGIAETARQMVSVMLPSLAAESRRLQQAAPNPSSTDDEPPVLIEARLAVPDADAARRALVFHPDFEAGGESLTWWGDEMSEATDGPRRWSRGRISWVGGELVVEVHSRGSLERLTALLTELGQPARVVEERPTGAQEEPGWLREEGVAPDEPISVLDGHTLREAAALEGYAERVEVFLRELEHRQAAAGQEPAAAELRRELGVPAP
jgi:hypothetical protein